MIRDWFTSKPEHPIGFRAAEISALRNRSIVEQHADEAAFLWTTRAAAVRAPHYNLKDLAALDDRVQAHLEGLRVAVDLGWEASLAALETADSGCVFAATILALEPGYHQRLSLVVPISLSAPGLDRGLISAMAWLPLETVEEVLARLLGSQDGGVRALAVAAAAAHRWHPGAVLAQSIRDPHPRLRACALKACGVLGDRELLAPVRSCLTDEQPECRSYSAWAAARLGDRSEAVFNVLQREAEGTDASAQRAFDMALRVQSAYSVRSWYERLKADSLRQRSAVVAAGILGLPEFVADLIRYMDPPQLSRIAGFSFSMITGVDLAYEDLDRDAPEGFQVGPTEEAGDDNVTMDPDENLPWPDPLLVARWWNGHSSRFQPELRYLRGQKIEPQALHSVLREGTQPQRTAAALELGLREPEQPLFPIAAQGRTQMQSLGLWNW